ncbi:MAG: cell division protein FtsZ [Flavobacteriales bacterium]
MSNSQGIVFDLPKHKSASIKVIGVGGGGSNAVNHMFEEGISGVDFVICNTDAQALNNSPVPNKIQLGASITEGLGAGANPEVGKQAALESAEEVKAILDTNTKMVFITAGMGGGTGTGAAPIIAGMAKEAGILTVGIVTVPFYFEGTRRMEQAEAGVEELQDNVDSLIVINNDKLRELYGNLGFKTGFAKADEVLAIASKGIAEVITNHYKQNIDLRDAKTVLADSGTAIMGSAIASGDDKAKEAIIDALDSPLLNNNKITGAKNVLLLIVSGNEEITIDEIGTINDYIQTEAGYNANIIMGIGEDEDLGDSIRVTIVATGFPSGEQKFSREEKKTVHTLLEDQPITKVLSPETVPVTKEVEDTSNPILKKSEINTVVEQKTQLNQQEKQQNLFGEEIKSLSHRENRIVHTLLEEEEVAVTPNFEKEEKFVAVERNRETKVEDFSFEFNLESEKKEIVDDSFETNNLIEQEDNLEKYGFEVKKIEMEAPDVKQLKNQNNDSPFDTPFSTLKEVTSKTIEDRRDKLKSFSYKFKQSIKDIEDSERIPAYKRQGIELPEETSINNTSRLSLNKDSQNELQIRENNSFLHDNVD